MLALSVTLKAKPGKAGAVIDLLRELAACTRAEPGCHFYVVGPGPDADTVVMLERYADKDAFRAHATSPHIATFGPRLNAVLECPPQPVFFVESD